MGSQAMMCDYYGFPHISRIFYMKESGISHVYEELLRIEERYPHLYGWFARIRNDASLQKELIPP